MNDNDQSGKKLIDMENQFPSFLSQVLQDDACLSEEELMQLSLCRTRALSVSARDHKNYSDSWFTVFFHKKAMALPVLLFVGLLFFSGIFDSGSRRYQPASLPPSEIVNENLDEDLLEVLVNLEFYEQVEVYQWLILVEEGDNYES